MTHAPAASRSPTRAGFPARSQCAGQSSEQTRAAIRGPQASPAPMPCTRGPLPLAENVLAVVARPGQESVDLGGLLYSCSRAGTRLALLCMPEPRSGWLADPRPRAAAARAAQRSAAAAHASQSEALPQAQHRLDRLDGRERLRWLARADRALRG
jgi:LmbE family N-acetylglucosaminyl deacetylase